MRLNLLQIGMMGVDLRTNPLMLGEKRKLRFATNIAFEEGVMRTRPGFRYTWLGCSGQFQGAADYRPSRGISAGTFEGGTEGLAVVVEGSLFIGCENISGTQFKCDGPVHIYQAENYLILQSPETDTFWWNGDDFTRSPGMSEADWADPETPLAIVEEDAPTARSVACSTGGGAGGTGNGGTGEGDGGGGGCAQNQGYITFRFIDNATEEALTGVTYDITVNESTAYAGVASNGLILSMEEETYDYSFTLAGYVVASGSFSVIACQDQEIDIRFVTEDEGGGGGEETCGNSSSTFSDLSGGGAVILNTGTIPLTLTDFSIAGVDPAYVYYTSSEFLGALELPITISSGESISAQGIFPPEDEPTFSATVVCNGVEDVIEGQIILD